MHSAAMQENLASRDEPIPGYRLIERLGRGGFGEVWKVEAPGGFPKAMKFLFGSLLLEGDDGARQELRALSRVVQVRHPFILSLERYDIIEGQLVIVTELADRNLDDRAKECRQGGLPGIPRDELLRYLAEAAEALDLMSDEFGLQHLDIKPTNLFLIRKHVKVADFGLVHDLSGAEVSISGGMTPLYAPPETFGGKATRTSDQYSLALVYQEMLCGVRAIRGENPRELMCSHLVGEPFLDPLPEAERAVMRRALAKDPTARFPSCTAFVEALLAVASTARKPASSGSVRMSSVAAVVAELPDIPVPARIKRPRPDLATVADNDINVETPRQPFEARVRYEQEDEENAPGVSLAHRPPLAAIPARSPAKVEPDGLLCPTLAIGLGRVGLRFLHRFDRRLRRRFGAGVDSLPVRCLGVDVEPEAVAELERFEGVSPALRDSFFAARLRKASDYRQQWDSMRHVTDWMSSEQLLRIGQRGDTRGLRALGRLALVDNYSRFAHRLTAELSRLLSPETAARAAAATNLGFRRVEPKIIVVAGLGGGAGAGMAIDVLALV
ncbi:MAG TPA: serine/threonine-protein kinase, partial [Planctomycetia bacterium]|nr:serine/threonine-protein kinase [Planctomycetia bacterium]